MIRRGGSCRKWPNMNVGFSPCGMLSGLFDDNQDFFRSLFSRAAITL
jgi:hypothetical protein